PKGDPDKPLKALLVDSWYDPYLGVVILVRIVEGTVRVKDKLRFMSTGIAYEADRVGVFTPKHVQTGILSPGEMGFITCGIKTINETKIGDTITFDRNPCAESLPGFKPSVPMVFCSIFPLDASDFEKLRDSLG